MWYYDFVKWTAAPFLGPVFRTKRHYISGKKPKGIFRGDFIVASNHISYLDAMVVGSAIPSRRIVFVATKDLFQTKWGPFFRAIGIIEIDKENPSVETMKKVKKRLRNGHLVGVFPEGTISRHEDMKTFKAGIVMMAVMAGVDILPMYLGERKTFKQRKVAIIGEKLKYDDLFKSPFPTIDEIENVAALLAEKEKELENKYKELYKE